MIFIYRIDCIACQTIPGGILRQIDAVISPDSRRMMWVYRLEVFGVKIRIVQSEGLMLRAVLKMQSRIQISI